MPLKRILCVFLINLRSDRFLFSFFFFFSETYMGKRWRKGRLWDLGLVGEINNTWKSLRIHYNTCDVRRSGPGSQLAFLNLGNRGS